MPGHTHKVKALSRCFIRSRLSDNPDLAETGYGERLDQTTQDLRRTFREGDFTVGMQDATRQVVPTRWVELAMQRWTEVLQRLQNSQIFTADYVRFDRVQCRSGEADKVARS